MTNARFIAAVRPFVGQEVSVWTVRIDRPYCAGTLLRAAEHGLVIAGKGVVPYDEIDRVACHGQAIAYAPCVP